jgi:hypothetical protein
MDPGILFGSRETIEARVMDVMRKARSKGVRYVCESVQSTRSWCSLLYMALKHEFEQSPTRKTA